MSKNILGLLGSDASFTAMTVEKQMGIIVRRKALGCISNLTLRFNIPRKRGESDIKLFFLRLHGFTPLPSFDGSFSKCAVSKKAHRCGVAPSSFVTSLFCGASFSGDVRPGTKRTDALYSVHHEE